MVAVTSATAASKASTLAAVGRVMPLTLRTYWRAAASISSAVAAGSRPRSSVMFRHMKSSMPPVYGRACRNRVLLAARTSAFAPLMRLLWHTHLIHKFAP